MIYLNDSQVTVILNRITDAGITDKRLQDDLLDHYCCFIEDAMATGNDFEIAYKTAFIAINPNGMHEIQQELNFILTLKQTSMKQIIYGCGFLAVLCLSTGIMFRTMHWPGVPVFMFAGSILLIITSAVLFSNAARQIKTHTASYNLQVFAGFISVLLISTGSIFKILLYPGANIQLITGMALFNFIFLPLFFYHLYRQATLHTSGVSR